MGHGSRAPETDFLALAFVAGLVAWYAGGSSALDRLVDAGPMVRFTLAIAGCGLVAGAGHGFFRNRSLKTALTEAALLAAVCALLGCTLAALLNRHADRSDVRVERAVLTGFANPSKGPRMASFALVSREGSERLRVQASVAEGCNEGAEAKLEVRQGFLGMPWVARVSCPGPL